MVDIEIPAQTQERAVRVGLSEARKGPDVLGSAFAHSECRARSGVSRKKEPLFLIDSMWTRKTAPKVPYTA